jgi:hypothetical protein
VPINVGGELSLGFTRPLLVREHSPAPIPRILGIGATTRLSDSGDGRGRPVCSHRHKGRFLQRAFRPSPRKAYPDLASKLADQAYPNRPTAEVLSAATARGPSGHCEWALSQPLLVGAGLTGFWSIGRAPTRPTAVDNRFGAAIGKGAGL